MVFDFQVLGFARSGRAEEEEEELVTEKALDHKGFSTVLSLSIKL